MKNVAVILTTAVVVGCAGTVDTRDREDAQYRLEDERVQALERYEKLHRSCTRAGGIVFVSRHNGGRVAPPLTIGEMKSASCSPPAMF
jgi:hypothetical protein